MMKCLHCLGTAFSKGRFAIAQVVDDQPVLIQNVTASRCKQCGYLVVSATTAKKIERIVQERMPDTHVPTAVYDLASRARPRNVDQTPSVRPATASTIVAV